MKKENDRKDYHRFSAKYLWITDKKGNKIKLEQNHVQRILEAKIKELRSLGIPPRIVMLKSRQMGMSTDTEGRMVFNTSTKANRSGLVVAHERKSVASLFAKTKYFYDNLPDDLRPLMKASNSTELIFDQPTNYKGNEEGINSKVVVQIAGRAGIGRGDTNHYVHLSEYAFWEGSDSNSPDKQLIGIMQSVPDELDTWVIIETTANGMNEFKDLWDGAVNGANAFTPLFLPWYEHEEYVKDIDDVDQFMIEMEEYEQWLFNDINLALERVAWWRYTKKHKCNGDINLMRQENPTTPDEAFIFSGTPVFDNDKVIKHIERLKVKYAKEPYKEGYFIFEWNNTEYKDFIIDSTIRFIESTTKPWVRVYEERKSRYPYVLTGDTKGEGKDQFTGQMMDNTNGIRVATLQIDINSSKEYTWQMYCLGMHYNTALIAIEMNFNTAPLEELTRLKYDKQYYREKSEGYNGEVVHGKIGWKTDGVTRPRMIDNEVYLASNYIYRLRDIPTLQEMLTFVYDKNGRPDAMSGKHDDLLIADCMLDEVRGQQSYGVDVSNTNKTIQGEFFNREELQQEDNSSFVNYGC